MSIALVASPKFDLPSTASLLGGEGLEVITLSLKPHGLSGQIPSDVAAVILVVPTPGVVSIGEPTEIVRDLLDDKVPLTVCCPQPTASDRRRLCDCGASTVVTPRTWEPAAVAERVLAELIVAEKIEPRTFGALRGGVRAMRELYEAIDKVSPHSDAVLVLGETGTGKELVAQEIHLHSGRSGPFIAIDCAALTPELLQSELFGHEKGAFTGAITSRVGLLTQAGSGTVFLDEIGDLPLSSQAKLLRVLEEWKVRPVGSNEWHDLKARLVFATNRDLEEACELGRFRQDLYARLSGLTLRLPALRTRRADIPWLMRGFLDEFNRDESCSCTIPPGAADCLFRSEWPRNVRELRQAVRKAAIFAATKDGPISTVVLQEMSRWRETIGSEDTIVFDPATDRWQDVRDRAWSRYSKALLQAARNNKTAAAKSAGMSRSAFLEKLAKYPSEPSSELNDVDS